MLERIREGSQGITAKIILGLVIASFAVAGVGSYINTQGDIPVAEVNGLTVSQSEFGRAYQNQRSRMEAQFGELFEQLAADPTYMSQLRENVLDNLINQKLSDQLAADLGLRIGNEQIKQAIFDMAEFQVDGQFDNDKYIQLLSRAGFQPSDFREMMREDMLRRQLVLALTSSEFTLENEAVAYNTLQNQTRSIEYVDVAIKQFEADLVATEDELSQKYQADILKYQTEEQVALSYIDLSVDDLMPQIEVTEQEVLAQYDANQSLYTQEERRRASHILINSSDDESAAKEKADALLADIKAGADFAELAKSNSDDTFSGENGGDLNFFGRGIMASEFEDAAFALAQVGDVSEVVQTSFGYHIIKLTGIEAESIQPLDEVKAQITETIQRDKANILFGEKQDLIANLAFEVSDSLDDAAAEAGVEIQTTALFSTASAPALLNSPKVLQAAFSADVAQNGYNSELIEVSSDRVIVLRASDYAPARTQTLDEVKDELESAVVADKATAAAEAWAQETLTAWQAGDVTEVIASKGADVKSEVELKRTNSSIKGPVVRKAFELAKPDANATYAWLNAGGSVALIKLTAVTEDTSAEADATAKQRLLSSYSDINYRAFVEALKSNASISRANLTTNEQTDI